MSKASTYWRDSPGMGIVDNQDVPLAIRK
jgi:hypothetical protein